jgi:lipoprotein signal peptidase
MDDRSATRQTSVLRNKDASSTQAHMAAIAVKPAPVPALLQVRRRVSAKRAFYVVATLGLLIAVDQLTKYLAYTLSPSAVHHMLDTGRSFGMAWHIHEANDYSTYSALAAFGLITIAWTLPINFFAKMMWTAAAISNHVEMLARPGTMDFIAFRFFGNILVANVADLYFVLGVLAVGAEMVRRIRETPTWTTPVHA